MYLRERSYKTKQKINKRLIISISVLAVVIIAIIGLVILISSGRDLKNNVHKAVFHAQDKVLTQKNGIIYTNDDNLIFVDYSSKQIWSKKMFSTSLSVTASEENIAVYNKKSVQVFDLNGNPLYTKEVSGSILNVRCGANKIAVITEVETEEEGLKKFLTVYNKSGETIDTIPFEKQNIIDIGFYGKNSKLWVLTLDTTGVIPISHISTYDTEKQSMTGIININGQLIEKLIIDENTIYASGTTNLNIYSMLGEKKDAVLIYGWSFQEQFYSDNKSLFLYIPRIKTNNSFDSLRLIQLNKSDLTVNLPPDVIKAAVYNNKIYCFSKKKIYKYSLQGKREDEFDLPYTIDKVTKIHDRYAFLVKGTDIFVLSLP